MSVIKSVLCYFLFLIVFTAVFISVCLAIFVIVWILNKLNLLFILKYLGVFSAGFEVGVVGISCAVSHFASMAVLSKMTCEHEGNILLALGITFFAIALFALLEKITTTGSILSAFVPIIYGVILIRKKLSYD